MKNVKNLKKLGRMSLVLLIALLTACSSTDKKSGDQGKSDDGKAKIGIIKYMDQISLENTKEGFIDGLKEEGIDAEIEEVNENGDSSLTTTAPKKFSSDDYDLVFAIATPAAQGAKQALPNKNIIFAAVTDPVQSGLLKSYDEKTNIKGITDRVDIKSQLATLKEMKKDLKKVGIIYSNFEQNSLIQLKEAEEAAKELNLELETVGINNINEIPEGITYLSEKIDALYALTDNTVASAAPIVSEFLKKNKVLSLSAEEGQVINGLLMSQGVDYYLHGKQAAKMAARILKGEDIKSIEVEDNKDAVKKINKKMADALGIDLSRDVYKGAEIVEK
ncbi:ABC transporter substrate-binding protein [Peptoniphilus raoultii]|uniref:ABC transporter substrate-binding protein n=1 Tax=Peptoniphilus raoultii TaxID=1776387 RepID=UPI0008D8F4E1|nr:ABC transporter substrate-binding protein [Peptoniphilus raoultii]